MYCDSFSIGMGFLLSINAHLPVNRIHSSKIARWRNIYLSYRPTCCCYGRAWYGLAWRGSVKRRYCHDKKSNEVDRPLHRSARMQSLWTTGARNDKATLRWPFLPWNLAMSEWLQAGLSVGGHDALPTYILLGHFTNIIFIW